MLSPYYLSALLLWIILAVTVHKLKIRGETSMMEDR